MKSTSPSSSSNILDVESTRAGEHWGQARLLWALKILPGEPLVKYRGMH